MSTLGKRVDAVMCLSGSNPDLSVLLRPTTFVLGFEEQVQKVCGMYIVYILKSLKEANQYYVGLTEDLGRRLQNHNNEDNSGYSKRYAPWEVETYVSFKSRDRAIAFEKYLKSGSGYAFLRKRLV